MTRLPGSTRTVEGRLTWVTGTAGIPGSRLVMQTDGNLVVRRPDGRAVWQSGTDHCGPGYVLDTSRGAIVKGGTTVWTTAGGSRGFR